MGDEYEAGNVSLRLNGKKTGKTLEDIKGMKLKVGDIIKVEGLDEYELDKNQKFSPLEYAGYLLGCYKSNYSADYEMVITTDAKNIPFLNKEQKVIFSEPEGVPMKGDVESLKLKYINNITKLVAKK